MRKTKCQSVSLTNFGLITLGMLLCIVFRLGMWLQWWRVMFGKIVTNSEILKGNPHCLLAISNISFRSQISYFEYCQFRQSFESNHNPPTKHKRMSSPRASIHCHIIIIRIIILHILAIKENIQSAFSEYFFSFV